MINALLNGLLVKDPVTKTGPSGKSYCQILISVPTGDNTNVLVSGIAFGSAQEKISPLKKGDAICCTGTLKSTEWQDKATGAMKYGWNLNLTECLTAYEVKKRRPKLQPEATQTKETGDNRPFDDDISF
jgi:single-strand DNA-binding protein